MEIIEAARRVLQAPSLRSPACLASSALKRHITAVPEPFMPKHAFWPLSSCISACISGPARAQDAAAPFDGELQRLAEILGTLHYLARHLRHQ